VLENHLAQQIRRLLGPNSSIDPARNGTIIALLPVDRDEAEQTALQLIETLQATPLRIDGQHDQVTTQLACGIIAFLQTGNAFAACVPAISR
jgi:hypothetical protein